MNIILKAFDGEYSSQILERALQGTHLGSVIDIGDHRSSPPCIDAKHYRRMEAAPLRAGHYPGVDWNAITPLDEEVIESMRGCEGVFLSMIERYARSADIPYEERKRQYLRHLRYWNHILETQSVDLLLMNTLPHQCYDLALYDLCKRKGITTLSLERCHVMDAFFVNEDWKESGSTIRDRLEALSPAFADPALPIPLSEQFAGYFEQFSQQREDPWYMYQRSKHLEETSFLRKWTDTSIRGVLLKKPIATLRAIGSRATWKRKLRQHRTALFYDRHTAKPDLQAPFIYVPLHYQPEATTCPMAGVFADQELLVQLLAAHLPAQVRLYVKEHPAQGEMCRSEAFYRSMLQIPSVTFVPRTFSTFHLTEHALAVATGTGTTAFEALFRQKPVLLFGHRFFQYAPGVFRIHSSANCAVAVQTILEGKGGANLRDMRLFLRAVQETTAPYVSTQPMPSEYLPKPEKAQIMGEFIAQSIRSRFPHFPE